MEINERYDEIVADIRADFIKFKLYPNTFNIICDDIKEKLNELFTNAKCLDVIYTDNVDKMFFGVVVMPVFSNKEITSIITSESDWQSVTKYKVEIDSRLITGMISINVDECTSFLLHDIWATIHSNAPIIEARYSMDKAIREVSNSIKISEYASYIELLGFGIKMTIRYYTSVFCNPKLRYDDITEFDKELDLTRFIKSGLTKLINNSDIWDTNESDKSIVMQWVIKLYTDILKNRIPAIHTLEKCLAVYPSELICSEFRNLIMRLKRIDDFSLIKEETTIPDSNIQKELIEKATDIKSLTEAFAEIKALPVETYSDVYNTIHRITVNMAMIDYVCENTDISKNNFNTLMDMREYYDNLLEYLFNDKMKKLSRV